MSDTGILEKQKLDAEAHDDDVFYCAACTAPITRERFVVSRRGDHAHTVFNPAGRVFTIRCFSDAEGVLPIGEPTAEFTWFPHYAWRFALCGACGVHLGWRYEGTDVFFGLIKQAITQAPR